MPKKGDPRDRVTLQFQLDITRTAGRRDENLAMLDYIDEKKRLRQAKQTLKDALALFANLENGETKELLEQFPQVYQKMRDEIIRDLLGSHSAMNFSGKGRMVGNPEVEDLNIEFEIKRDLTSNPAENFLRSLGALTGTPLQSKAKPSGPKKLDVPQFEIPSDDEDDDLDFFRNITKGESND